MPSFDLAPAPDPAQHGRPGGGARPRDAAPPRPGRGAPQDPHAHRDFPPPPAGPPRDAAPMGASPAGPGLPRARGAVRRIGPGGRGTRRSRANGWPSSLRARARRGAEGAGRFDRRRRSERWPPASGCSGSWPAWPGSSAPSGGRGDSSPNPVPSTGPWTETLAEVRRSLGLSRAVRLLTCEGIETPVTGGWRRPVVLLPPEATLVVRGEEAGGPPARAGARAARRRPASPRVARGRRAVLVPSPGPPGRAEGEPRGRARLRRDGARISARDPRPTPATCWRSRSPWAPSPRGSRTPFRWSTAVSSKGDCS